MNNRSKAFAVWSMSLAVAALAPASRAFADDTAVITPSTAPTTAPATAAASVTPEASKILDQVNDAYVALKSLELTGTLTNNIEAGGQKHNDASNFTASFSAPNKFRHAMKDDLLAGSTGQKAYTYLKSKNVYTSADAPAGRVATSELPKPLPQILEMQDPSLMLAVAQSPRAELTENVEKITTAPDTTIDGVAYQTLVLGLKNQLNVQLLIDSQTHLIRQSRTDVSSMLAARGVPDIKAAVYTVDYTASKADGAVNADQYAWTAPANARDLASAAAPEEQESPAMALVGKPAPALKLDGLDGKSIALADLKGSVVVLDFWATWCGPCRGALPHLNEIYDANKGNGLKVFAVNLQEEKAVVQKFVDSTKLTIPVLLDTKGDSAHDYMAEAIPETVVVGKDGKVAKVLVGAGPENEAALKSAIAAAMK